MSAQHHHGAEAQSDVSRFSSAAFGQLRWIEGAWKGISSAGDRAPFYERYTFTNDSTLTATSYADSSFRSATGTVTYALRDGEIAKLDTRWIVTNINAKSVTFSTAERRHVSFSWTRTTADQWTVDLFWPMPEGTARHIQLQMNRAPAP